MSFRLMFLTGHLSGLLLGAALVWTYVSNRAPVSHGTANPPSGAAWLTSGHSSGQPFPELRAVVPQSRGLVPESHAVPHDWKLREFNGQPYYLIPIETLNRSNAT